jgi:hypothetical protein
LDRDELPRRVGQPFVSIRGYEHVIFQPHATQACNVSARLDRAHHPGAKDIARASFRASKPRRLVHFETQAMTSAVEKGLTEPARCEHVAGGAIDFRSGTPGRTALTAASCASWTARKIL